MGKIKISQEVLYQYLLAHDIKLTWLADQIGVTISVVSSRFLHHKNRHGTPRSFNAEHLAAINEALPRMADELRGLLLEFGSASTYTDKRGSTFDPEVVGQFKQLSKYLNITGLVARVLGWTKLRKQQVLTDRYSIIYGHISQADTIAINNEVLSIIGALTSYEVVSDTDGSSSAGSSGS